MTPSGDAPEEGLRQPELSRMRAWDRGRAVVQPRWLALAGIVLVLLGAGAWAITEQGSAPRSGSKRAASGAAAFTQFKDPAGAFGGSYPSTWTQLHPNDAHVVLLASGPDGASFLVRKTPIAAAVAAANLGAARALTDRVVRSGKHVKLLRPPQAVTLGGLPGYLYLYTFVDPSTGERGAHAHYFLFQGATMITLVFQSLPSNNFVSLAPLFDRTASTFHALPG